MLKRSKNQRGFTSIEVVIVIVILALVGVVGWYVAKHRSTKPITTTTTQQTPTTTKTPTTNPTANNSTNNDAGFLTIKELGIKLPLSSQIKDLVYTYNKESGGSTTTINYLHFATTSISAYGCGTTADPLGTYSVYASRQTNEGVTDDKVGTLEATVDGHYIYYHHVQYGCGDTDQHATTVASLIEPVLIAVQHAQAL